MDVFKADLARLDEAAAKVKSMRESAENAVKAMHLVTHSLLEDVTLSIRNAENSLLQSKEESTSADAKAAIMNDFVEFLMENVDIRNANGLAFLAQAFVWQDSTLVQKFIDDSTNIVIYAKAAAHVPESDYNPENESEMKHQEPAAEHTESNGIKVESPQETIGSFKRAHHAASNDLDKEINTEPKKRRVSNGDEDAQSPIRPVDTPSKPPLTPQPTSSSDVEAFVSHVEKKLGKAFANKWLRVVARKPWTEWATSFVPLLPGNTPGQVAFNQQLQQFFVEHGRALWERYFFLGTELHSKNREPMHRFIRLRAAMGHLIHDLYALEGADIFLFLEKYPHPSWPLVFLTPMPLESFPNHSRELLAYFQDQCNKRWPTYHGYWTPPATNSSTTIEYGHEVYRPLAFLEWAATRNQQSCAADQWTFMESDGTFFASLLGAIAAKRSTFNSTNCPYVSVALSSKVLPKQWRFPNGPHSMYKWDPNLKQIVVNEVVATGHIDNHRRTSSSKRLSGGSGGKITR